MELVNYHTISEIEDLLSSNKKLNLSENSKEKIKNCNAYLLSKISDGNSTIYGVNTGFGSLCNTRIDSKDLAQLQVNLIRSHACGMGDYVPHDIIKLMLLLKVKSLSYGHSGVQLKTVEKLLDFFNTSTLPVIYELGSLGASGDLAPLSHMSLPLIGEGKVWSKDSQTIESAKPSDLVLGPKEGLALINGTQFMQAYGLSCLFKAKKILERADVHAALCLDAYDGRKEPFLNFSHVIRPHKGQLDTAKNILEHLSGSQILDQNKAHVQDPYSFRCVPQVHGASKDVYHQVASVFETEINAVTDNPNVFPDEDLVLSAGNFHGQPLALHLDFLAIAIADIGSIAERRIYRLLEGKRDLPAFLTSNPGLESGLMIAQYTADTIESSNGQEDHVSMGANAATKCLKVIKNVERIQAIELLTASKALRYRSPLKSSDKLEKLVRNIEKVADISDSDKVWADEVRNIQDYLRDN